MSRSQVAVEAAEEGELEKILGEVKKELRTMAICKKLHKTKSFSHYLRLSGSISVSKESNVGILRASGRSECLGQYTLCLE